MSDALTLVPALDRPDLLADPVRDATATLDPPGTTIQVAEIDPELADTAAFCERYHAPRGESANCVLVAGKRGGATRMAAVLVLATTRADVNGVVRRLLDVRKASFASRDAATGETGMEYGGHHADRLPGGWPVYLDSAVVAAPRVEIDLASGTASWCWPAPCLPRCPASPWSTSSPCPSRIAVHLFDGTGRGTADELVRCGVIEAVLCPGSRTPRCPLRCGGRTPAAGSGCTCWIDERTGAYLALGLACCAPGARCRWCAPWDGRRPNLHPAVLEASYAGVPLLALTADRPPELVGTGANQTVGPDRGLFAGGAPRWRSTLGAGRHGRRVRQAVWRGASVARAVVRGTWTAAGGIPGPVHRCNLPFSRAVGAR